MNVNTMGAVFGAFVAVFVAGIIRALTADTTLIAIILGVIALICYIIATATVKKAVSTEEPVTALTRGVLIGINSVFNGYLVMLIINSLFNSETAGLVVGLVIGALEWISSIGAVSRFGVYQGLIGWLNWLLPMSWLIVGLGLLFLSLSLLGHLILWLPFHVRFFRFGIPSELRHVAGRQDDGRRLDDRDFHRLWRVHRQHQPLQDRLQHGQLLVRPP